MESEVGSSWWGTWFQVAKEKSASVLELVKHDLAEFTQTVQQETSSVVTSTAATIKEKLNVRDLENQNSAANRVKQGVSDLLHTVSSTFTPFENEEETDVCVIHNSEPVVVDRLQLQLMLIQRNPSTYLDDPSDNSGSYEEWLKGFELSTKQNEMVQLMTTNLAVQTLYGKLVPSCVSHVVFWHRYFYHVHKIEEAEQRHQLMKVRNRSMGIDECLALSEKFRKENLPSVQQTEQLLQEYQKECEERSSTTESTICSTNVDITDEVSYDDNKDTFKSIVHLPTDEATTDKENVSDSARNVIIGVSDCFQTEAIAESVSTTLTEGVYNVQDQLITTQSITNTLEPASPIATTKGSGGSSLSNEDEWEKEFDLEVTEDELHLTVTDSKEGVDNLVTTQVEEDWEKWE